MFHKNVSKISFYLCGFMCIFVYLWDACGFLRRPKEGVGSPMARGTDNCEPLDTGTGN